MRARCALVGSHFLESTPSREARRSACSQCQLGHVTEKQHTQQKDRATYGGRSSWWGLSLRHFDGIGIRNNTGGPSQIPFSRIDLSRGPPAFP